MLNILLRFPSFFFYKKQKQNFFVNNTISTNIFFSFLKNSKKYFFNSIKEFFFFYNRGLSFLKKKEIFLKKFKVFFFNYKIISSNFIKKKKKFFFFDQKSVFLDTKVNLKVLLLWAFPGKLINDRFFFKKYKIESVLLTTYFHKDLIFNNFSRFINYKYSSKYKIFNITVNNSFSEGLNKILRVGDTVKFYFSLRFIYFFIQSECVKFYNFFNVNSNSKGKIKENRYSFKVSTSKRNFNKYSDLNIYGFDISFLNFSSVKVFNSNSYLNNFFFQQYLNLFSWRLYEWNRK